MSDPQPTPPSIDRAEVVRRQQAARDLCQRLNCAGLIAFGGPFYDRPGPSAYLSNHFPPFPTVAPYRSFRSFGYAATVIPADPGRPVLLFCDGSYREDLVVADEVVVTTDLGCDLGRRAAELFRSSDTVAVAGLDILPDLHEEEFETVLGRELVVVDDQLWELRMIKSPAEQELLRHAARIADVALEAAIAAAEPGVPETHVCAVGTATALRAGADFVRYLRVHSGPWSRVGSRWPQATSRRLAEGDIVYLDVIGAAGGYQFDVLRVTTAGATPDPVRRLFEVTYEALQAAVAEARAGRRCRDLYRAMRRVAEHHGCAEQLGGFAGHGIGLETVEPPFIVADDPTELQPGMVLCVEPKFHLPGVGGASIEYEVIITDGDPEVITKLSGKQW